MLGAVELLDGDPAAAHRYLWRAWELVRRSGAGEPNKAPFLPDEIEGLIQLGQLDRAEQLLTWFEERGRVVDRPRALATAARCRGLLLAHRGDLEGLWRLLTEP